jgi:hypothetical protein
MDWILAWSQFRRSALSKVGSRLCNETPLPDPSTLQFLYNELIFRSYSPVLNFSLNLNKKTFTSRGYNSKSIWLPLLGQTTTPQSSSSEPAPGAARQPCISLDEATKISPSSIHTKSPPQYQPEMTSTRSSNKVLQHSIIPSQTNILRLIRYRQPKPRQHLRLSNSPRTRHQRMAS